jgi:membrane associated rhomboid family serine protease
MVRWGILPRTAEGLIGIFTCPFIHADNDHLLSNTLPILVVGTALIFFYRSISLRVIAMIWLLGGFWTWLMARDSYHIGASGLIYGAVVFLFFSGIFRKDVRLMAISFLVVFLYGSLAWGILPIDPAQSWEAHLTGSIAGFFAALHYRSRGPQRIRYSWEEEPDEPSGESAATEGEMHPPDSSSNSTKITYHYLPGEKQDGQS